MLKALHVSKKSETAAGTVQILFVLLVVGGTIGITAFLKLTASSGPALSSAPEQIVVDVLVPATSTHTAARSLTGQVEARANVAISPQVTGRVVSLHPNLIPGGTIKAGEILFSVEPTDYEIALKRSRSEVAGATADLTQAKADASNFIKDWERVYPNRPAPALVAKEPQIKAIEARLAAAEAAVQQAQTNLARTRVTADNTIRIIESSIEVGQLLSPSGQYGSYYVADGLRIRASTRYSIIRDLGLRSGSNVEVIKSNQGGNNGSNDAYPANIISVGAALDDRTQLQPLIISVPAGHNLTPGTFVTVRVSGSENIGVFALPAAAMATRTSVWRVSGGKLEETTVSIIDITEDQVIVRSFDAKDGIVVSQVPTSFAQRPVKIRNVVSPSEGPTSNEGPASNEGSA